MTKRIAITGNTYPVKDQLKALGGRWNADERAWMVPVNKANKARALMNGAPKTNGRSQMRKESWDNRSRIQREWDRNNGYNGCEGEPDGCGW